MTGTAESPWRARCVGWREAADSCGHLGLEFQKLGRVAKPRGGSTARSPHVAWWWTGVWGFGGAVRVQPNTVGGGERGSLCFPVCLLVLSSAKWLTKHLKSVRAFWRNSGLVGWKKHCNKLARAGMLLD